MQFRKIPCCLGSRQTDYTPPRSFFIVLRLPCQPFIIEGFRVRSWLHLGSVLYRVLESGKKTRLNCVVLCWSVLYQLCCLGLFHTSCVALCWSVWYQLHRFCCCVGLPCQVLLRAWQNEQTFPTVLHVNSQTPHTVMVLSHVLISLLLKLYLSQDTARE